MRAYQMIEPSRGATYNRPGEFAVYEYDTYPRSSVLAGQERRTFIDSFDSLEAAQSAYPNARVSEYSLYRGPDLSHLPDDDDDGTGRRECRPAVRATSDRRETGNRRAPVELSILSMRSPTMNRLRDNEEKLARMAKRAHIPKWEFLQLRREVCAEAALLADWKPSEIAAAIADVELAASKVYDNA